MQVGQILWVRSVLAALMGALLSILLVGAAVDAGGDDVSFTFVAGGDIGATVDTTTTLTAIAAVGPDFVLALGDLSYSTIEPEAAWCRYIESHLGTTPIEIVVGNHEDDAGVDGDIANFASCLPDSMDSTGTYGTEYFFDVDNLMRVIMIGADSTVAGLTYNYEIGTPRYNWLATAIDDANANGIPWVTVGMHKVCLSAGVKSCEVGADLMDLLIEKRVDLVLSGHEHNYQRSKQLGCGAVNQFLWECVVDDGADDSYLKDRGPVFVVSGAMGGKRRYTIAESDPEFAYFAETMGAGDAEEGSGFLKVDVDRSRLAIEFVGTTSSYTDRFDIVHAAATVPELVTVSTPLEDIGSIADAGAVTLLNVRADGSIAGASLIHQGTPGVPSLTEAGDGFGSAVAWADLDQNGIDDLIVGVPYEDIGTVRDAGAIVVLYDAAAGALTSAVTLHQGSPGIPALGEAGDQWGYALAVGDLNNDSYPDVAIGAPEEAIGSVRAGAITVLFGSSTGLTTDGALVLHQDSRGVPGVNETGDRFGASLAVSGSADGSAFLAVGSPAEDIGAIKDAGAVTLFATTDAGPMPDTRLLYQGARRVENRPDVVGTAQSGDQWGITLAANSRGSLLIGAPFDDPDGVTDAGSVTLYSGFGESPATRSLHQGTDDVPGSNEVGDRWGERLDTDDELIVVGAPREDNGGIVDAGRVTVLPYGAVPGDLAAGKVFTQTSVGTPAGQGTANHFGSAVALTSGGSLVIAVSGQDMARATDVGAGTVVFAPMTPAATSVGLHQGIPGVPGLNEAFDEWGG